MRSKFKSFTDINNYNNFLLDLDKEQNKIGPETDLKSDKSLTDLVSDIDKTYNKLQYSNNNFTGVNNWDRIINLLKKMDPNLYDENEEEKEKENEREREK